MCLAVRDLDDRRVATGFHGAIEFEVVVVDLMKDAPPDVRAICGVRPHYCGYVRVEPGHPWYGLCDEIDADVFGGPTFAKRGTACATHGPEDEWWIGFDTAHGMGAWTQAAAIDETLKFAEQAAIADVTR